ncbi:MAG: GIY-YIG nuclease family protein [Marinicella sp.]
MKTYWVYILTNQNNSVLYIGITSNLESRIYQHKNKMIKGFTARYNVNKLIYFEDSLNPESAILREKQLKGWVRKKKIKLINQLNPTWRDLSLDF